MGILTFLRFLLSYRHTIYALRRRYDRVREKTDRQSNVQKRNAALQVLDQIEPTLVMLEEQSISGFERGRLVNYVNHGIDNANLILKEKFVEQARRSVR